ncbi:XRE family transcriptional regulator [Aliivibrio fischeri]|uniref:XRE family transcriptional regulator n=1 Tax=Aliivibrio fischeri TaxID=668 RepID=UPI0007C4F0D4|nr:XRE family transcriptional regulator [Aliivibrio fischeri]MBP3155211.1 helix-turn-helix transcriptional regulator [Aliivibrio fischeri]MCE7575597.1 XRE family transcriptional regulator [Aliivibrio fischeri]
MGSVGERIKLLRLNQGLSQESLADKLNVTKSTISQWEIGKAQPKNKNLLSIVNFFDTTYEYLKGGSEISDTCPRVVSIPYYNVSASAGLGSVNDLETYSYVDIENLNVSNIEHLVCITASGDSMEPVLKDGSVLVVNTQNKNIVDGNMYVFRQDDFLRVKLMSYEKNHLRIISYNKEYKDEIYNFSEISDLSIVGQVIWYSTKLNVN